MDTKIRQNKKIPRIRLIHRQQKWTLTAQGWGVALLCAATLIIFTITHIHPFLAVTSPRKTDVLVVEGLIPDYALKQAVTEFKSGNYRQLITTGEPLQKGFYLAEYKNFAEFSAATLKALGLEKDKVVAVLSTWSYQRPYLCICCRISSVAINFRFKARINQSLYV